MMENIKMDLHIHTPASKCYSGEDTDEQYLNILEKAVKENIGIIAITDHNTLAGYQRMYEIKDKLIAEKNALLPYREKTIEISERIDKIDEIVSLYSKVWIIAGVEFTLNPGIHLIILASREEINDLSALLDEAGYTSEKRGYDSEFVPNVDIKTFLNSAHLNNKIIFAPHVDSGQGIYNDLKGMYRATIFRNSRILAISCNSIKQLEKIQGLVKYDPNYKREKPWAYINASDAHCVDEIGKKTSFVKIENRKFENLLEAFENATECISDVENQKITELIEKLVKSQKSIMLDKLEEDEYEVSKILCACFNSDYNNVIIGVNHKKEISGIDIKPEAMQKLIDSTEETLANCSSIRMGFLSESLGNGRHVYIILIRNTITKLCYLKKRDEVFIYDKKVRKATIYEIEQIVRNRLLSDLDRFHRNNDDTIEQMKNSILTLQQPIGRYRLATSIEDNARYLSEIVDEVIPVNASQYLKKWDDLNPISYSLGKSTGNLYFARNDNIRLNDAVLRYTCQRLEENIFTEEELMQLVKIDKTCIVITEKGATYLIDECYNNTYIEGNEKFIVLYLEDFMKKYSIYSLIAWLKSSFFIWYMIKNAGSLRLYEPSVFKQIIFPCVTAMERDSEIEKIVKEIIETEKEFLESIEKCIDGMEDEELGDLLDEELDDLIDEHNDKVKGFSKQIDEIFFNALEVNERQKRIIIEDLNAVNVFNYLV